MRAQLERRLQELRAEYEAGQKMLEELSKAARPATPDPSPPAGFVKQAVCPPGHTACFPPFAPSRADSWSDAVNLLFPFARRLWVRCDKSPYSA
jgi:hypothetical protein